MMIDAFEELWNELDAPECLVWKKGSMMEKTIKKDIWEMISSVSYSTHIAGNAGRG